jgi:hypothetical protein
MITDTQAIDYLKSRHNIALIANGLRYESRLRTITEPQFYEEVRNESGFLEMKAVVSKSLGDKTDRAFDFATYPLPITAITKDITHDVNRVFDGRDTNFDIFYNTSQDQKRGEKLLAELGENTPKHFITEKGKIVLKNAPNSFIVVDKDDKGNPYPIFLYNKDIEGIEFDRVDKNKLEFIIFHHSDGVGNVKNYAFYDADSYRIIQNNNGVYSVIVNNAHDFGYCPARPFLGVCLNRKNEFNRWNPFAESLSFLIKWQLFYMYIEWAELGVVFPMTEIPKVACKVEGCIDGSIEVVKEGGITDIKACPSCSNKVKNLLGPGTVIEVPTARFEGELDYFGKVSFISPPTQNLELGQELQDKRLSMARLLITGFTHVMEKEAVNIEQVKAVMESARKPLLFTSSMLNDTYKWLTKTLLKGIKIDAGVHANFGTEWFLLGQEQIQKLFSDAKTMGMPESELDELFNLLVETKYKGNPELIAKIKIENELNPAPYKTIEECYKMNEKFVMSQENLAIKANITAFIQRFERENGSIVSFGNDAMRNNTMSFDDKINAILNIFKTYVTNEQNTGQQVTDESNNGTDSEVSTS